MMESENKDNQLSEDASEQLLGSALQVAQETETPTPKKHMPARIFGVALAFVAFMCAVLAGLSALVMPYSWQTPTASDRVKDYSVLFEKENTLDVLIFGDSEAYCALSPLAMYSTAGFTSYVCSVGDELITRSEQILSTALQRQNPKVVVIETDFLFTECSTTDVVEAEVSKILPLLQYHDRWKALLGWGGDRTYGKKWGDSYKGFRNSVGIQAARDNVIADYQEDTSKPVDSAGVTHIEDICGTYLKIMVQECQSKGIEVVLLSTPSMQEWTLSKHNGIQEVADELGVTYLDLNYGDTKIDIDWTTETRDMGNHLNYQGAHKVCNYVAEYLDEHYDLPNHWRESNYESWDTDLETYESNYEQKLQQYDSQDVVDSGDSSGSSSS